jgi:hypothetical protein
MVAWDGDGAPGEGEVVIGGEQGDQTESQATDGQGQAEVVRAFTAGPGDLNGDQAEMSSRLARRAPFF